jgi:hypothetical protein
MKSRVYVGHRVAGLPGDERRTADRQRQGGEDQAAQPWQQAATGDGPGGGKQRRPDGEQLDQDQREPEVPVKLTGVFGCR